MFLLPDSAFSNCYFLASDYPALLTSDRTQWLLLVDVSKARMPSSPVPRGAYPYNQLNIYHIDSDSGIGLETSILFAREGANVLMADISEPALEKAQAKLKEVVPTAPRVETIKCDVSKESDVQRMVDSQDSWGGTDVIFNNAGIMHADDADAIDTPEKIWDLTHNINVKGVWFGSKHAVQSMRRNKKTRGSIINTASVVALVGAATPQLAYTASKGAVLAMTRELAIVHAREGFRFNALCPAPLKYVSSVTT